MRTISWCIDGLQEEYLMFHREWLDKEYGYPFILIEKVMTMKAGPILTNVYWEEMIGPIFLDTTAEIYHVNSVDKGE